MKFGEPTCKQRVAVGRRAHDRLDGDIAAGAGPVLDQKILTDMLRQPLAQQPRDHVGRAAGIEADDQPHRPRRKGFGARDARRRRQRGHAGGETQKVCGAKVSW